MATALSPVYRPRPSVNVMIGVVAGIALLILGVVSWRAAVGADFTDEVASVGGLHVNQLQAMGYGISGAILVAAAISGRAGARIANLLIGIALAVATIGGALAGRLPFGLATLHLTDNLLHGFAAILLLWAACHAEHARRRPSLRQW